MNTQAQLLTPFRLVGEEVKVQFGHAEDSRWSLETHTNVPCTIIGAKEAPGGMQYLVQQVGTERVGIATESQDASEHGWGELQCDNARRFGAAAQGWTGITTLAEAKQSLGF